MRLASWAAAAGRMGHAEARSVAFLQHEGSAAAPVPAGKEGYFGPPYFGLLCPNLFNTARLTPLNWRAHSAEDCRRAWGWAPSAAHLPAAGCKQHATTEHQRLAAACPRPRRLLYEETCRLLEDATGQRPLPNKLPGVHRRAAGGAGRDGRWRMAALNKRARRQRAI